MTARAYYNEIDPFAAQWLRNLIAAGHIAPGDVDERSIKEVAPDDLNGYTQAHFFAGIGVWSHALRLAGWPDDLEVWSGSCPCQPFSAAGLQKGLHDARHLWPDWFRLIAQRRPSVIFGEQVAHKSALPWLDAVCADLEGADYAVGASDLCVPSVGAPHIRQRLYFVADADSRTSAQGRADVGGRCARSDAEQGTGSSSGGVSGRVADRDGEGRSNGAECDGEGRSNGAECDGEPSSWREVPLRDNSSGRGRPRELGNAGGERGGRDAGAFLGAQTCGESKRLTARDIANEPQFAGAVGGHWGGADWLHCRDNKWRPVEPGTFPLANGTPGRVGRLRAYGNAIVAPLAAEFVRAYLETRP